MSGSNNTFIGSFTTYIFMFSTAYTLLYFWLIGSGGEFGVSALVASDKAPGDLSWAFLLVEWILDIVSWISPFALVRGLVLWLVQPLDPNFFTFLDLLFLRPISWIASMISVNYAVSKIPTVSGET